jgi:hypothetical protein
VTVPLRRAFAFLPSLAAVLLLAHPVHAAKQLTLPPSGDNQRSTVIQGIGLVQVRIDYSSPDVHAPDGSDRRGKIWGDLVPWGLHDLGFNNCTSCPWRAGANENTVFTVSHDVKIEGQPLAAGSYGLHMLADPEEWTVIFSRNFTSWGSYTYDPKEDALRVKVKPQPAPYREWLTYEFIDRQPDRATVALQWEELSIPLVITVDDMVTLYMDNIRRELRDEQGFTWVNWNDAALYALQHQRNLDEALGWARRSIEDPFAGNANFQTLTTLAQLQIATGKDAEGMKSIDRALALPSTSAAQVHQFARRLQAQGKKEQAMRVFQANARKFRGAWPTTLGLARGLSELGDTKAALVHARRALAQAPDEPNRKGVQSLIQQLEARLTAGGSN